MSRNAHFCEKHVFIKEITLLSICPSHMLLLEAYGQIPMQQCHFFFFNPIALRKAKIVYNMQYTTYSMLILLLLLYMVNPQTYGSMMHHIQVYFL